MNNNILDEEKNNIPNKQLKIIKICDSIANTIYTPFMLIFAFHLLRIASQIPSIFNFLNTIIDNIILLIYNSVINLFNEELENSNYTPLKYSKFMNNLNKKLKPLLLALNMSSIVVSGYPLLEHQLVEYKIEKENPFNEKIITLSKDEHQEAVEIIIEGIENNIFLTESEKFYFKALDTFFKENPYLVYNEVYKNFCTIDVYYKESEEKKNKSIGADYNRKNNDIRVYNEFKNHLYLVLGHEGIHATGKLDHTFLNEGLTSIIVSEYIFDGEITDSYSSEIYLTELIIELTSKDTVLQAFSQKNEDLIIKKLEENQFCPDGKTFLDLLESYNNNIKQIKYETVDTSNIFNTFTIIIEKTETYLREHKYPEYVIIYVKNLLYQTILDSFKKLPKFNYNQEKDNSYPDYEWYNQESIHDTKFEDESSYPSYRKVIG